MWSAQAFLWALMMIWGGLQPNLASAAGIDPESAGRLREVIDTLSFYGDRSTGTAGSEKAAAYIKERFDQLGFETVGSHEFSVPVIKNHGSTLSIPKQQATFAIQPFLANAITPGTIPEPGVSGPLVYVGSGNLHEFNGKPIEGAIVLMELDSAHNWLQAANLGAKALIYVDRGNLPKMFYEEKFELSPVQFPRFWMPLDQVRAVFGDFEHAADGLVADEVQLVSQVEWESVTAENVYCLIPGTHDHLSEQLILVNAFYDSRARVAGRSPGAEEACGLAVLLDLARYLKDNPPQRSVLLVATGAHAQTLAGMRELIWSIDSRSKDMRKMRRDLRSNISRARATIEALSNPRFETGGTKGENVAATLLHNAVSDRIKTESDLLSRQLMHLRLQHKDKAAQALIAKLADERQQLRQLLWRKNYAESTPEERKILGRLIQKSAEDQKAILADARLELRQMESALAFRGLVRNYDLVAAVSLHLSTHGDGFGPFDYGWLYPFRPRINRTAAYAAIDEALRLGAEKVQQSLGISGMFKDTLRPSTLRSWQSYFLDKPALGGEVSALAGIHGLTFVTTDDARSAWGTPYDTPDKIDMAFAVKQNAVICGLIRYLAQAARLNDGIFPRNGLSTVVGRAKFLRLGELFAEQPAPGTVMLCYQGPARFYAMVDHMGGFLLKGAADKKHSYYKVIFEGYKFSPQTGAAIWTIDKRQTGKDAYRLKMQRRNMETDLIMFAGPGTTVFDLLEPRTFRYLTKVKVLDGRLEAQPLHWFISRLDTWSSIIASVFLESGTPLKMTMSDTVLRNKLVLLNGSPTNPDGSGYMIDNWPFLRPTEYLVARDMWTLLSPRISNLEKHGIFNEIIRKLEDQGLAALHAAEKALTDRQYDRFLEASATSWALATRVYDDVESTEKDVLYGVLFYIALFVPFAFCMERLLFSFVDIYKRIIAFFGILVLLIFVIYNVHPAFQLAYSPMVVILAFLIMGLSAVVTLIIFFRFEDEMSQLQKRAKLAGSEGLGRWKAFAAAFLLGVSNLRRRRLRTVLTCTTLIILTFTIMSFTSVKSMRHHARILYRSQASYQGFLLKNAGWKELPPEAFQAISNSFLGQALAAPRVWLEDQDKTRALKTPVRFRDRVFQAQGVVGLSHLEPRISGLDRLLVGGRWFREYERQVVVLSERTANQLGLDPRNLNGARVLLWGMPFEVVGVFSGKKFQNWTDLDGEPLTPVIFPREVTSTELSEVEAEALESGEEIQQFQSLYQHVAAELTILVPYETLLAAGGNLEAVAVRPFSQVDLQAEAQEIVDRFGLSLFSGEADGNYLYHASNTISYSGVPNVLIPMLISVFIVLNTMIGSVYERRREIAVYTSVGLAPSHVSFLFIAEAMALAVLSVVLGYLVAQTTARLFAETSLWAGITVNYSSLAGVGAMLLVIIVVLVSVLYPSKVAGEIAIPDVNRSWTLPPAQGNSLQVTLPFLMKYKEHRSIGGFLVEYFRAHQDVSHGMFSTGDIRFGFVCDTAPVRGRDSAECLEDECDEQACLKVNCSVWLAPFDFGIKQRVDLAFSPAADERGFLEIQVQLTRLSGEANAWHRINKEFLHNLRRQLLIWRSFDDDLKDHYEQLLAEAPETTDINALEADAT